MFHGYINNYLIVGFLAIAIIYWNLFVKGKCKITKDLTGQVIIITGANSGIGKATASTLATMGATVVIGSRDPKKSLPVIEELKKETGNSKIEFIPLDLADLKSVKAFADEFKKKHNKLDILINNAGAIFTERKTSKDGYELQFATNCLGPIYLTNLLLDVIKKSAPSRIINLSSDGHYLAKNIKKEDIMSEKGYNSLMVYCRCKFANAVFTKDLQKKLEDSNVKVVCLHPGMVRTGLTRAYKEKWYNKIGVLLTIPMMYTVGKSPEEGAQTTLYCALEDHDKLKNGAYYRDCKQVKENSAAFKEENWKKLSDLTDELISKAVNK